MTIDRVLSVLEQNNPVPHRAPGSPLEPTETALLSLIDERSETLPSKMERDALKGVPDLGQEPPKGRRISGPIVAAAVFAAIVGLVAVATLLITNTRGDEPADTSPTLPSGWVRVPHDEAAFGDARIGAVTRGGPGYVAVGGNALDQNGKVWVSEDGRSWRLLSDGGNDFADAVIRDITHGGSGLVAVGSDFAANTAAVWTSTDGVSWSKTQVDPTAMGEAADLLAIASGGPGVVAVGEYGPRSARENAVWTSSDGISWSRIDLPGASLPLDIISAGPRLVAVGRVAELDQTAIWISTDGTEWTLASDAVAGGGPSSVAAGGGLLVATGQDHEAGTGLVNRSGVFASPDGSEWTRVADLPGAFNSIVYANGTFTAVGGDTVTDEAAVAISADGETWSPVVAGPGVFADGRMADVVVDGSVLIAVGTGELGDAAIWTFAPG